MKLTYIAVVLESVFTSRLLTQEFCKRLPQRLDHKIVSHHAARDNQTIKSYFWECLHSNTGMRELTMKGLENG